MEFVDRSFPNPQAHRSNTRALPGGLGVPSILFPEAVGKHFRNAITVRLDHILAEEGKLDVRLERFVASADAAADRDQHGVVVFVSQGNCETWVVRQKAAMLCSLEFSTGCLTLCSL